MKKIKIFGTILAITLTFPIHFIYNKFPNFFTSILFPVNESIMEHMKILFGSIIISGIIQKLICIKKGIKANNVCFSNFVAAISSIIIFLSIFLPVYDSIGKNLFVTIIIMILSIIISEIISYFITKIKNLELENLTIILVILCYIIFGLLTYYPPKKNIFMDPLTNKYGLDKK